MDIALLAARLLIAIVFIIAGLTKLVDRRGTQQALQDFGLADKFSKAWILLPFSEIVAGLCLFSTKAAWPGALLAFFLLSLFIVVITANLLKGKTPECHCFGQLYSKPIGYSTLIRNLFFAAITLFILLQGRNYVGLSVTAWIENLTWAARTVIIIATIVSCVLALEGWLIINLIRQNGRLLLRMDALEAQFLPANGGLPIGTLAPYFNLTDLYGNKHTLESLGAANRRLLLIFWDPNCRPCASLLPEIARWQYEKTLFMTIALISRGSIETNFIKTQSAKVELVLLQQDREVLQAYKVEATPTAVFIGSDYRIESSPAVGVDAIKVLVDHFATTTNAGVQAIVQSNGHE